jgi:glucosamine--fructose-6-phosphate aminotransferase (isomerizing)
MAGALAAPSVATLYAAQLDLSDTLTMCVSQSGLHAGDRRDPRVGRGCGAATLAVTNVVGSPLAAEPTSR